jgi:drug/metabolite transporter (DMT)-like permease
VKPDTEIAKTEFDAGSVRVMGQAGAINPTPRLQAFVGIGVGILAISTASIFIRFAQADGAPSLSIAALRLAFASLILLPLAWTRCRAELARLTTSDVLIALVSGAFLGAHFATWISSLQYTTVTSSVVLVTMSPLFVALGSAVLLKERLTRLTMAGMVLAIGGGVLIGTGDAGVVSAAAPNPLLGNLLALAGAICIAPYFLIGRRLRRKLSLLAYISLVYGTAAIVLLFVAALTQSPLTGFDPQVYVWILLLALLPQLVGHTSFNWSLGHFPATFATIPALGEPIGSTILAIVILGEFVTPLKLVGGALTLAGIGIMMLARARQD